MTREEFRKTRFRFGMRVEITEGVYEGKSFDIVSPDFDQDLIGCDCFGGGEDLTWFRCENCKLVNPDDSRISRES